MVVTVLVAVVAVSVCVVETDDTRDGVADVELEAFEAHVDVGVDVCGVVIVEDCVVETVATPVNDAVHGR